ncbi:phenylalanine--tRNA ligase subunit beta [Buchnera aphidicola (Ceratovacuna keduensis)]|uniref:phenylalanine--tRNA ligase subunit beta n=1 Tax=Buchnera aphidicola TaxID=9 RepID=UPI0031B8B098
MKISKNWIMEWINFPINFEKVCKNLTKIGIEVEKYNKICMNYDNLMVGKIILKKEIFLDKKKFFIYSIKIKKNIVIKSFSLFNCKIKSKIIVSTSKNQFSQIVYSSLLKYHHYNSKFFICSPFSIGISNIKNIPVKLPSCFDLNENILKKIKIFDNIFKFNIPYNRLKELNIIGICREIYAIYNINFNYFKNNLIEKKYNKHYIKVLIEKKINNYCYLGRKLIKLNMNIKTPLWISKRLKISNIKSQNVLYDIINYVYLETGEHFHFFEFNDFNKKIFIKVLKCSKEINVFKKKIFLKKNSIVLCNKKKILVFGNNFNIEKYGYIKNYANIFLGSLFLKKNIFTNNKKIDFNNRKINYFYHSSNIDSQLFALKYITKIILMVCGGYSKKIVNFNDLKKNNKKNIFLYNKNISRIIGCSLKNDIIENILKKLNYTFLKYKNKFEVFVPSYRNDILIEEDVISDIIRFYGIDNIPYSSPCDKYNITYKNYNKNNFFKEIKFFLISKGYSEVINYSFINFNNQKLFSNISNYIDVKNPISKNMSVMRSSLFPGLLENFVYNINRQNNFIKIFELGLCYFKNKKKYLGIDQKKFLSCLIYKNSNCENFNSTNKELDFYDLKGDLEYIFEIFRLNNNIKYISKNFIGFDKKISSAIFLNKKYIGKIGKLDKNVLKNFNFNKNVDLFLFEICIENISKKEISNIEKISEYPKINRDISIIVLENVKCYNIINFFKKIFFKNLIDIYIFDIYTGKNISSNKKSISIRLVFQSLEKTLKEINIDNFIKEKLKIVKEKFNATIREK